MRKTALLLMLLVIFALPAIAQDGEKPNREGKAIVYVYSLATSATLGRIRPSVFVDDVEIAQIRPNRFFVAYLSPGTHSIHFKKKKKRGGIETTFEAGKTYFLRVNWKAEGTVRPVGFDIMTLESARYDLKQLKPVDEDNLKDKSRVSNVLGEIQ